MQCSVGMRFEIKVYICCKILQVCFFDVSFESRKQGASAFVSQGVPIQTSLPSLASDYRLRSFCRAKRRNDKVLEGKRGPEARV